MFTGNLLSVISRARKKLMLTLLSEELRYSAFPEIHLKKLITRKK